MGRLLLMPICVLVLASLATTAPAKGPVVEPEEGPDPRGLTLSGTGFAHVRPPVPVTEASIRRAVAAARPHAMARAVAQARDRATALAAAAGLTLGEARAVTERDTEAELGYSPVGSSCFGGRRPRCRVPLFSAVTVTVTFATAETSAAATGDSALVASGVGRAPVRPRNPRSSASIREALARARPVADAAALTEARADAARLASSTGAPLGALLAIAERHRPYEDPSLGSFGPGRYCGAVRRAIVRRDPATGRRRVVRRVTQRRCFFARTSTVALRLTYAR
jgi:uncharacterized protein YggE